MKDLRGKCVGIFESTNAQLPINRLLEVNGLAEKDLRALNLDTASGKAALVNKDIDALFSGFDLIPLRMNGKARIVCSRKGDSPIFTRQGHVLVSEESAQAQPALTTRLVKAVLGLLNSALTGIQRRATVQEHIELVGLKGFENAYPYQLSAACRRAWRPRGRW